MGGDHVTESGEPRRSGRRPEAEAERTRRRVVAAALSVFADKGFEAASLRDIATAAGAVHGLIRHHFGSKEGVWRAAVDFAVDRATAVLRPFAERAFADNVDPVAQARGAIRAVLEVNARHPELARLLMHEGVRGGPHFLYALERYAEVGDRMAPLFERVRATGHLAGFDDRSFFLFVLTGGVGPLALPALSAWALRKPRLTGADRRRHIDRFIAMLLPDDF